MSYTKHKHPSPPFLPTSRTQLLGQPLAALFAPQQQSSSTSGSRPLHTSGASAANGKLLEAVIGCTAELVAAAGVAQGASSGRPAASPPALEAALEGAPGVRQLLCAASRCQALRGSRRACKRLAVLLCGGGEKGVAAVKELSSAVWVQAEAAGLVAAAR